jgi:hypothetical protein
MIGINKENVYAHVLFTTVVSCVILSPQTLVPPFFFLLLSISARLRLEARHKDRSRAPCVLRAALFRDWHLVRGAAVPGPK